MKDALLLLLTCYIFQRPLYAFHKESYYGDPYSMEYVGKFSTVNLTKEDLLFADYVVEMLRNTSYTTIDFNASITYPLKFRQFYETGVTTMTTRRFATTSTKSPTTEKKWRYPGNEDLFGTEDVWQTPSSISFDPRARKFGSSPTFRKTENRNTASLCIETSKDKFQNVRDIIKRNIIQKPSQKYTERPSPNETTEERKTSPILGPWLTSKEQEQVWALRGTSLLDSEKYDFPFPYDFDKWPGCTTKDLSDPKNTILILQYDNDHMRVLGVSKPGWNEFPWKPTEFTTAYPAYRRLDRYLTYLSRPWYGYYSTLHPTLLKKWDKKSTQPWSRYTFENRSRKTTYDLKWTKKWSIDKWPLDWNRTVYPQTFASTWKRTWWGGKWPLNTRIFSNASATSFKPVVDTSKSNTSTTKVSPDTTKVSTDTTKVSTDTAKSNPDMTKSNAYTTKFSAYTTKLNADTTKLYADVKKPSLNPRKPVTNNLKSTSGFGFLSLSPTWYKYSYEDDFSNVTSFRPSNATWISEWSRIFYEASKSALNSTPWIGVWGNTSDLSLMGQWSNEISIPLYTYPKFTTRSWLDLEEWITEADVVKNKSTWRRNLYVYDTKPKQSQPKQGDRENLNQWNKEKFREWSSSQPNLGGWSLPALTKTWTQQWTRQPATWSKAWYSKSNQPYYSKQYPAGGQQWSKAWNKNQPYSASRPFYTKSYGQNANQRNLGKEQQRGWGPWTSSSQYYRRVPPVTNQWGRQQPQTWSKSWYTTKPYQYRPFSKQSVGGWSKQWNQEGSRAWSKSWYTTKSYQPYTNQRRTFGGKGQGQQLNWRTKPRFTRDPSYYQDY